MTPYDLRSDFLSPPTAASIAAMAKAAARPSGFGLREDPEQVALERDVAALLGKEDALLMPTCTMANLVACAAQISPGEIIAAEATSHCLISEAGGMAAVAGGLVVPLPGNNGEISIPDLESLLVRKHDAQASRVAFVVAETTHNRSGGVPLSLQHLKDISALSSRHGAALHIDGARLFNACVALNIPPDQMAKPATSVAVSLNKGLGAPTGAILAGPADFIARALVLRQRFGGGLRPSGAIAAAARESLKGYAERLETDHANAALLAEILMAAGFELRGGTPRTNILLLRSPKTAGRYLTAGELAGNGVLGLDFGEGWIRLCLHAGIASSDIPMIGKSIVASAQNKES